MLEADAVEANERADKFEVLSRPRQDFATNDEGLVQEEAAR